MDIHGDPVVKRDTGMAFVTGFSVRAYVLAVDGLGEYTGTGRLADTSGTAEQKGMRQLIVPDGIFEGGSDMRLPHYGGKTLRPVFSCRNNKFVH
jgi:hypothetical protein